MRPVRPLAAALVAAGLVAGGAVVVLADGPGPPAGTNPPAAHQSMPAAGSPPRPAGPAPTPGETTVPPVSAAVSVPVPGTSRPSASASASSSSGPGAASAPASGASGAAADGGAARFAVPRGAPARVSAQHGGRTLFSAPLVPTGTNARGELVPPYGSAGWYAEAGWAERVPGAPGPSIVAAHVSRLDGAGRVVPDHFHGLHLLRPGDTVVVAYDSGEQARFTVVRSQAVDKTEATDVGHSALARSIWRPGGSASRLRLFTCDASTPFQSGHYLGNWVVWADRVA